MHRRHRRILVVGNYRLDRLQSMDRYAGLLVRLYRHSNDAEVQLVRPPVIITRLPCLPFLARKYLAYIDKLILFPLWLALRSRSFDLVHIADHSNGFYSFCCDPKRCITTCHDLLAVRGALGDLDAACTASPFGIWLQRLIMAGLRRSGRLLFVSNATYVDYLRLGGGPDSQRQAVIANPLNADFSPVPSSFALPEPERLQLPRDPYLLMVGSALPRKNRKLALQILQHLGPDSPYYLVFAGAPLSSDERHFCSSHPLGGRVISVVRPSHALLNQLYCHAHALLFPSLAEGFGWPLVEAQACDCPVIASTTTSIPEVAGAGALYASPHDVEGFVAHVRTLGHPDSRAALLSSARANLQRFSMQKISLAYAQFAFSS